MLLQKKDVFGSVLGKSAARMSGPCYMANILFCLFLLDSRDAGDMYLNKVPYACREKGPDQYGNN